MTFFLNYASDILIIFASLGAMAYCMVLSRRLSRLTSFDKGLGGAIAVMSSQVDEMKAALKEAKSGSDGAGTQLNDLVHQAREISAELEMMIAACHDFAEEAITVQSAPPEKAELTSESDPADASGRTSESADIIESAPITFGSRRVAGENDANMPSTEPLFGRRKSVLA